MSRMKLSESKNKEVLRCTVSDKEVGPYWDTEIPTLNKMFYLILETFQFEVFSFLMSTKWLRGRFKKFLEAYNRYFSMFNLGEERISRALDISLDAGFLKAYWVANEDKFFREFENKSEASEFLEKVLNNCINRNARANVRLFDRMEKYSTL